MTIEALTKIQEKQQLLIKQLTQHIAALTSRISQLERKTRSMRVAAHSAALAASHRK